MVPLTKSPGKQRETLIRSNKNKSKPERSPCVKKKQTNEVTFFCLWKAKKESLEEKKN